MSSRDPNYFLDKADYFYNKSRINDRRYRRLAPSRPRSRSRINCNRSRPTYYNSRPTYSSSSSANYPDPDYPDYSNYSNYPNYSNPNSNYPNYADDSDYSDYDDSDYSNDYSYGPNEPYGYAQNVQPGYRANCPLIDTVNYTTSNYPSAAYMAPRYSNANANINPVPGYIPSNYYNAGLGPSAGYITSITSNGNNGPVPVYDPQSGEYYQLRQSNGPNPKRGFCFSR